MNMVGAPSHSIAHASHPYKPIKALSRRPQMHRYFLSTGVLLLAMGVAAGQTTGAPRTAGTTGTAGTTTGTPATPSPMASPTPAVTSPGKTGANSTPSPAKTGTAATTSPGQAGTLGTTPCVPSDSSSSGA